MKTKPILLVVALIVWVMLSSSLIAKSKAGKTSFYKDKANYSSKENESANTNKIAIKIKPEPDGWFTGDIHVHRSCGGDSISVNELKGRMEENDLAIISVLADMGNSQAHDRIEDLSRVDGKDNALSEQGRIIHWGAEWHWDADEWSASHQALGGHLVLLGIKEAYKIWEESPYKILEWAKKQNAVRGFAHMQYLNDQIQNKLNCCIPIDYPVEAALKNIDFVAEDVTGGDVAINAYYKLLDCGFRLGLAAGTDYPCNGGEPFGTLLTYVEIKDKQLTYQKWIEGIRDGRTVVSLNGHNEFLSLKVDENAKPGDEIKINGKKNITVDVEWSAIKKYTGWIEIVCNGKVIARCNAAVQPEKFAKISKTFEVTQSSWICARRMDESRHRLHTAPVYITLNGKPVRANVDDARFFISWIDNILENIKPGGIWNKYFPNDLEAVRNRYIKARNVYEQISLE